MNDVLNSEYDVVVCGAGPAGLLTARTLALNTPSLRVALLDKRDPWREPVACAEAVATSALEMFFPVDPLWVRQVISGICFVSPDGTKVHYRQEASGLILDRALFHRHLAEFNHDLGVHCHFRSEVQSLNRAEDGTWLVQVRQGEAQVTLRAATVVDASGPGGKLTRHLTLAQPLENGAHDLEPAVFTLATGIEHRTDTIELHFGSRYFPGGYGWVFPRSEGVANVGIVVGREYLRQEPVRDRLKNWIAENWPHAELQGAFGGSIACGQSEKSMACDGLFKVGDAASGVNPISRSGIVEAMKAGRVVGETIPRWLAANSRDRRAMEQNVRADWMRVQGNSHRNLANAKKGFYSITDSVLNRAAHRLASLPDSKRTLFRIFLHTLLIAPSLLWKMRSMMR